jgi:hypothetical protein
MGTVPKSYRKPTQRSALRTQQQTALHKKSCFELCQHSLTHLTNNYAAITEHINHQLMLQYCLACDTATLSPNVSDSSS